MDVVEVGGLEIAFERQGAGPPLVLLHGFVGHSREWRRQIDDLSEEFTVVAWDAPGAGRSSDPPETFRLPDYADCLAAFIDAVGLRRPHIVGLSFGGALALELYRRHPHGRPDGGRRLPAGFADCAAAAYGLRVQNRRRFVVWISGGFQARDVEPSSSAPGVDELLGRETRPSTQVSEVTFQRAGPNLHEFGGVRD